MYVPAARELEVLTWPDSSTRIACLLRFAQLALVPLAVLTFPPHRSPPSSLSRRRSSLTPAGARTTPIALRPEPTRLTDDADSDSDLISPGIPSDCAVFYSRPDGYERFSPLQRPGDCSHGLNSTRPTAPTALTADSAPYHRPKPYLALTR